MPFKFEQLATYNAECSRGIVHTAAYDTRMAALQAEFDEWSRQVDGVSVRALCPADGH